MAYIIMMIGFVLLITQVISAIAVFILYRRSVELKVINHLQSLPLQKRAEELKKIAGKYSWAPMELGSTLNALNDYKSAAEILRSVVNKGQEIAQVHYSLGYALSHLGEEAEAEKHLLEAIKLKPDHSSALNSLGVIYLQKNENDKAAQYFNDAIKSNPENANAMTNLAILAARNGDYEKSEEMFKNALILKPGSTALNNLSNLMAQKGDYETTSELLTVSLSMDPENPNTSYWLGCLRYLEKKFADAEKHLEKATRLAPDMAQAHYNLALVYEETGKKDKAAISIEKACELSPELRESLG